jgi:hypothetical protein
MIVKIKPNPEVLVYLEKNQILSEDVLDFKIIPKTTPEIRRALNTLTEMIIDRENHSPV